MTRTTTERTTHLYGVSTQTSIHSQSQSYITTINRSVGQPVLVSGTHLGPATNFSLSLVDYFYTVAGLLMWGALSVEKSGL
jgi:hypothetical protein